MNKKLMTALVASACFAGTAFAFKTEFFGAGWLTSAAGVPIHEEITREALSSITVLFEDGTSATLNTEFINALAEENTENDEAGITYGQMHFDDSRLTDSAAYVWNAKLAAITAFNNGNPSVTLPGSIISDGNGVQVNLGSATHTIQDFFAHSTWTEVNISRRAAGSPLLPVPRIGIFQYPFSEGTFASVIKLDTPATFGSSGLAVADTVCDISRVLSPATVLSSAYYDFAMSDSVDRGFFTDNWVGLTQTPFPLSIAPELTTITWPKGRCVHGGDGPANGINKDKSDRPGYLHARKAAVQATRAFMLDFLASANVLATSNKAAACLYMFNCRDSISSAAETPKTFTVTDVQAQANFEGVSGKVLQIQSDKWLARMLSYSYQGVACTAYRPFAVDDDTDATYDKIICPSTSTGPGTLKIVQTALPSKVLHTETLTLNAPAPVIADFQLRNVTAGNLTTFTITGTNLPSTPLDVSFAGCANIAFLSQTASQHTLTCTPQAGSLSADIRAVSGGPVLGSYAVIATALPLTASTSANLLLGGTFSDSCPSCPAIAANALTNGNLDDGRNLQTYSGSFNIFVATPITLDRLILYPYMTPNGNVSYEIQTSTSPTGAAGTWTSHGVRSGAMANEVPFPIALGSTVSGVRVVKVIINSSPSWVALGEIEGYLGTPPSIFYDNFRLSAPDPAKWIVDGFGPSQIGPVSTSAGLAQFGAFGRISTNGKATFTGSKIVIEARMAGTGSSRDTSILLKDLSNTTNTIYSGDTNYCGWGMHASASGIFEITSGALECGGANKVRHVGVSTNQFMEYRWTIDGNQMTVERGATLTAITETMTLNLGQSIVGRSFLLSIGTASASYSPGTWDWVRVSVW
jgi:hypothetical protein